MRVSKRLISVLGITLLGISFFSSNVFAWGKQGHEVIAGFAWDLLSPKAKAEWQTVLGPDQTLISVANWADGIRHLRPETSPWHWITLQVGDPKAEALQADTPNVAYEILRWSPRLAQKSEPYVREEALKWETHLIGDLHQPLHTGEMQDRGGNDTWVRLGRRKTKLHQVWDDALIARFNWTTEVWVGNLRDTLAHRLQKTPSWRHQIETGNPWQWANETHQKARLAYELGNGRRITPGGRVTPLASDYLKARQSIVYEQLLVAGIRLASVLEASASGQKTFSGFPLRSGEPKRSQPVPGDFFWSTHSRVYHRATCEGVRRIKPENLRHGSQPPRSYKPHGNCLL